MSHTDSDSDASSGGSDGSFGDWDSDGEDVPAVCLFCEFADAPHVVRAHMEDKHGFSWSLLTAGDKSVYGGLRAINYIRSQRIKDSGLGPDQFRAKLQDPGSGLWSDDALLQPVLPQDALLSYMLATADDDGEDGSGPSSSSSSSAPVRQAGAASAGAGAGTGVAGHDGDDDDDDDVPTLEMLDGSNAAPPAAAAASAAAAAPPAPPAAAKSTPDKLAAENAQLRMMVESLQTKLQQSSATLRSMLDDDDAGAGAGAGAGVSASAASTPSTHPAKPSKDTTTAPDSDDDDDLDPYFESYSNLDIHEEMLRDVVRTESYRTAILRNAHLFKDKVVLDVGCGTGILSMFAASAGAKHVYGIDRSHMIKHARAIVAENGLQDKITLIQAVVEEVELPVDSVDIIISEWMGYFLLYESMLDSVLFARDKWLVDGGLLFPDKMHLYVELVNDAQEYKKKEFWRSVYGYKMTSLHPLVTNVPEPEVHVVDPTTVCSSKPCLLREFDLQTVTVADLTFTAPFSLKVEGRHFVQGMVGYFDTTFSHCHPPVTFSTSAASTYTHWKQTTFHFDAPLIASQDEVVEGRLTCHPLGENHRHLGISIDYQFRGQHQSVDKSQRYRMV